MHTEKKPFLNTSNLFRYSRSLILAFALSFVILLPSNAARKSELPLEEIKEFARALEIIQQNYVDETEDTELIRDAIRGMLRDLDPYSVYLDKRQKNELRIKTQGRFGGLGIQVAYEKNAVKVISPIDDTPASRAGIQALDRIITIDKQPTAGLDLEQAVNVMRGKPGSTVVLEIQREGESKLLTFKLKREIIKLKSVTLKPIKDGYVYARISGFQDNTASDFVRLIKSESKKKGLNGVILDLRNNPGGLLTAAIGVSDMFITEGRIVSTEGRVKNSEFVANANGNDITEGASLLVLINGGSASASEIVAGALQDHERAIIVGTKSFGKGTVQSVIDLGPSASIKLTTARYLTPSGRFIHEKGIEPDIVVERPKPIITEKEGEEEPKVEFIKVPDAELDKASVSKGAKALFQNDPQLWAAYGLLQQLSSVGSVSAMKKGT